MPDSENIAGFLIARIKLEPEVLRHVVERILSEFHIDLLFVYPVDSTIPFHEEVLAPLIENGQVSVRPRDKLDISDICLLFSMKPKVTFATVVSGEQKSFSVPNALPVLEVDAFGRTIPLMNVEPREWVTPSTLFTRNTAPPDENNTGVMGYFPYFMIYRDPGEVGSNIDQSRSIQNAYGFRREKGTRGLVRADREIIVLVHGGSSAYGVYNSVAQTWPYQLQSRLNRRLDESGRTGRRFRVINRALPASALTESLSRHVILANHLMADYVITHVGWNEARNMVFTDPDSLDKGIFLHHHHTSIAKSFWRTQGTWGASDERLEFDNNARQSASSVANLILERLRQFRRLTNADGGHFIAGIQPGISSKRSFHRLERVLYRDLLFAQGRRSFGRMSFLRRMFHMLEERLSEAQEPGMSSLPFNRIFAENDDPGFWFWDFGHTTTACNTVIAGHYEETIWRHHEATQA